MPLRRHLSPALIAAFAFASHAVVPAFAAPAPWYQWKSTVDGRTFCSQTPPGDGWVRFKGPFDNGRCVKREPGDGDGLIRKTR